jgi:hypothetical protein
MPYREDNGGSKMKIALRRNFFTDKEEVIFESEDLKILTFKFGTGVEAVKLQNERGYMIVLPFKGHIIWEASFDGRIINMHREGKKEPKFYNDYFLEGSYGVFFFHCGALRMGCPDVDDDHIMHGELPCAVYDEAELIVGTDDVGYYVGITGTFNYNRGFGPVYEAHPVEKLYSRSTMLEISMRIDNCSNYPMELMYMAHLNHRPVDNSRIIQSIPWTPEGMEYRDYVPSHFTLPEGYVERGARLKADPGLTRDVCPDDVYRPEVGFYMYNVRTDKDGWAHIMQRHPGGTADFLMYKPGELDYAMRWISRTADQQGLALAFPSTCNIEGYNMEKKMGRVKEIAPKGFYRMRMLTGVLSKEEAEKKEALIDEIMR